MSQTWNILQSHCAKKDKMFKLSLLLLFVAISQVTCCFTEDKKRFYNASQEIFLINNRVSCYSWLNTLGGHHCNLT